MKIHRTKEIKSASINYANTTSAEIVFIFCCKLLKSERSLYQKQIEVKAGVENNGNILKSLTSL